MALRVINMLKRCVFFLIINILIFILIEGFASTYIGLEKLVQPLILERSHTKYDSDLGWINIPNIEIRNMYGPNIYLKIN